MIYRQEYMDRPKAFKGNKIIKVITGLRRSGKSVHLEIFCDELLDAGLVGVDITIEEFLLADSWGNT